ncbi:acetyltransferase (GNAT) family protein [Mobilisporobacter senegalensis]|uniref:Acetyltransferase (GNAT) family protein n=1 Tax=Mobilisporobacter senegalensis TaxID=1329262 RepID=A0A3N1XAZ8_9FIRM|nr:GNAT family N-acetyltransferase [Mobilisporobacter senegalensis]ROR23885.1 acetyltransferase (GNAT) family protein [Mobilisporobacter senegalensis]
MIEVRSAKELGKTAGQKISEIFVDSFYEHLSYFSKDKEKLAKALEHMFVLDLFYVAIIDGEIAGMTACTNGKDYSVKQDKKELIKHLGFIRGTIANRAFKSEFQKPAMYIGEKTASVEFVATASKYRGRGAATAIMNYLFQLPEYDEYVLEAADTNYKAVKLYEKLGYREFERIKQKFSKYVGINYRVYMKYTKPLKSTM